MDSPFYPGRFRIFHSLFLLPLLLVTAGLPARANAAGEEAEAPVEIDAASIPEALAEAEAILLKDPPRALALLEGVAESAPSDETVEWQGEEVSTEAFRERVETLAAAYAATRGRVALATYCIDQLIGPDRVELGLEIARRLARDGDSEAALSLVGKEKLGKEAEVRVLATVADSLYRAGKAGELQEVVDRMVETYAQLGAWERTSARGVLAETLVAASRLHDVVGLAHEAGGWESPYYMSLAAAAFPNWSGDTLRAQAVGLAQQQEPGVRAVALVQLAGAFAAADQFDRAKALVENAGAAAVEADGRDKVIAFAALAEYAARWDTREEAANYFAAAMKTLIDEMDDWRQTDALNEMAVTLAGTPVAEIAGPRIETAARLLSGTADEVEMRNKYRVYQFRGLAAAASPADVYPEEERLPLFEELLRLDAMADESPGE